MVFRNHCRPLARRGARSSFAFLELLPLLTLLALRAPDPASAAAPYPYSTSITNIVFNFNTVANYCMKYGTDGGDIWSYTWAADDELYTAYGDGFGFFAPNTGKVSWGISTITGPFQSFTFADIYYGPAGSKHGKIGSLLAISNATMNVIYAMNDIQDAGGGSSTNTALMTSTNHGLLWRTNAMFSHLSEFHGNFVQNGRNYSGNTDGFTYLYGRIGTNAGTCMARAPITSVTNKTTWQYLTNIDAGNQAQWGYLSNAISIFNDPNGWGGGADYDAPLGRWLLGGAPQPGDAGCFALYEGPAMWGPWKTICYLTNWANLQNNTVYSNVNSEIEDFSFPQKYMSADGTSLGMFMSLYATSNSAWNDTLFTMTVKLMVATSNSPPTVPTGLSAVRNAALPSLAADVSWNNVTNATSYQLLRSTTSGGPYTPVAYTGSGGTNYTDGGLASGTTYYYVVTAANSGGQSTNSTPAAVTTRTNAAPTLGPIASLTNSINAPTQTVSLTSIGPGPNETGQTLTVTASSGNTSLVPNPTLTYTNPTSTGTLSYKPVPNMSGTTFLTVKVQDNGGTNGGGVDTVTQTFAVTVTSTGPSLNDYRSVASGNWNAITTWQRFDGSNWVAASAPPNSASGLTTLQSPHCVTNATSITVAHVVVDAGAQLSVNPGTLFTVATRPGTSLDVFGLVNNAGTIGGSGLVVFEPGGHYVHSLDGGAVRAATWGAGSTCSVTGITNATSLGGLSQAFYHFDWNCPGQVARFDTAGALTNIRGNFSATAAASAALGTVGGHGLALSLLAGQTLAIGGDLNLTNVYLIPAGNASLQGSGVRVNLGGNLNTDGTYTGIYSDYSGNNRQLFGVISFTNTATPSRITQGPNANVPWDGSQAYSYRLAAGVTLDLGRNPARVWNFTNCPGSTLVIGNPDGIETGDAHGALQAQQESWNGGALAIRFPTRATNYFEPNATYIYNGSAAQVTGGGLPAVVANLTIDNPTVVSVNTRSGGAPYPLTLAVLTAVTNLLCVSDGTLDLGGSSAPVVNGLSGFGAITNGNLTLANSGAGLLPGGTSVAGTLTLDGALTLGASAKTVFELSEDPENGANDQVVLIRGGTAAGNSSVIILHPTTIMSQNDYVLFDVQGSGRVATEFYPIPAWSGSPPTNAANYRVVTVNNQVLLRYFSTRQPSFAKPVVSGTNLLLTGNGAAAQASYRLLSSTNVALPLAGWMPVLTNTFGPDGSFSNSVPINASAAQQFYRIEVP